jgi:hypothetical protein
VARAATPEEFFALPLKTNRLPPLMLSSASWWHNPLGLRTDSRLLIGCPLPQSDNPVAAWLANGGRIVGNVESVLLISVPLVR